MISKIRKELWHKTTPINYCILFYWIRFWVRTTKKLSQKYASVDFLVDRLWIEEKYFREHWSDIHYVYRLCREESKNLTTNGIFGTRWILYSGILINFDDARSGIQGISSTLNNNWLGGYITIIVLVGNVSSLSMPHLQLIGMKISSNVCQRSNEDM